MGRPDAIVLVPAVVMALAGCANVWTSDVRQAPSSAPLRNVLVVSEDPSSARRARWVDEVAADLAAYGVTATPATVYFRDAAGDSSALAAASRGYDGVIVIHLERRQPRHAPGVNSPPWDAPYGNHVSHSAPPSPAVETPDQGGPSSYLISASVEVFAGTPTGVPIWAGDLAWLEPANNPSVLNPPATLVRALANSHTIVTSRRPVSLHPNDSW